jgi:hypothetical protein
MLMTHCIFSESNCQEQSDHPKSRCELVKIYGVEIFVDQIKLVWYDIDILIFQRPVGGNTKRFLLLTTY